MKPKKTIRTNIHVDKIGDYHEIAIVTGVCSSVELISIPENSKQVMSAIARGYTGQYGSRISRQEIDQYSEDIMNTKLSTPLEMIGLTWLIKGVTRAWTHQAVRYRHAAYVQESMRFWGYRDVYEVYCPSYIATKRYLLDEYFIGANRGIEAYINLKLEGVEDQDARGTLPTNILTQLFMHTPLSTLRNIFETRWCCQAQTSEWLPVLVQMKEALKENGLDQFIQPPVERGDPCGFNASFDRPCTWKNMELEQIKKSME